jgi:hypothetical protein
MSTRWPCSRRGGSICFRTVSLPLAATSKLADSSSVRFCARSIPLQSPRHLHYTHHNTAQTPDNTNNTNNPTLHPACSQAPPYAQSSRSTPKPITLHPTCSLGPTYAQPSQPTPTTPKLHPTCSVGPTLHPTRPTYNQPGPPCPT